MRIVAPWPPKSLSPNGRPNRWQKARDTKAYRNRLGWLAIEAGVKRMHGPFSILVTFCPIGRGPSPDMDNCIAAFKAGQDGLADALGVNDRDLTVNYEMGDRCKDGGVIVDVFGADE